MLFKIPAKQPLDLSRQKIRHFRNIISDEPLDVLPSVKSVEGCQRLLHIHRTLIDPHGRIEKPLVKGVCSIIQLASILGKQEKMVRCLIQIDFI